MKRAITTHSRDFAAILGLLLAAVVVSGYILVHQGFRFPLVESTPFSDYVDLQTGQAVTPGQGQSVRVSGVQIGDIGAISLHNGYARVRMDIQPQFRHLIHTDATALLRPRTGLDDMFIELNPGRSPAPVAPVGFTIGMNNSLPDINLDEVLAELDSDTRAYLDQLINGVGGGLRGRGDELAQVLMRFEPTHRDLAAVSQAVAARGADLANLVHALARLNGALAQKQVQITSLVRSSDTVFSAIAAEDHHVAGALALLPSTLAATTDALAKVHTFAAQLGPAARNLVPAVRALPAANSALVALARPSAPIVAHQIRPFVRAAQPVVRELQPAAQRLAGATPNVTTAFGVLQSFVNMLGYQPTSGPNAGHGYLWWLAWADHNARSLFSSQDANGDFRNLFLQFSCASLAQLAQGTGSGALEETLLNLTPIITDAGLCPAQAKANAAAYAALRAGRLTSRQARDPLSAGGTLVPFLPKLPGVTR
ncbi:MAG TPA: MlaD family protein [Solirubrobacteraceae bacterium]|nr:MlaD family protein [Solirubrobacteraceae bacterium]